MAGQGRTEEGERRREWPQLSDLGESAVRDRGSGIGIGSLQESGAFGSRDSSGIFERMFAGRETGAPQAALAWGLRNGLKSPKSDAAVHGTQGYPFAVSPTSVDYARHRNVLTA